MRASHVGRRVPLAAEYRASLNYDCGLPRNVIGQHKAPCMIKGPA